MTGTLIFPLWKLVLDASWMLTLQPGSIFASISRWDANGDNGGATFILKNASWILHGRRNTQSFASTVWRKQANEFLRAYIAHLQDIGLSELCDGIPNRGRAYRGVGQRR